MTDSAQTGLFNAVLISGVAIPQANRLERFLQTLAAALLLLFPVVLPCDALADTNLIWGFTTLYTFTGGENGAYPKAALIQGSDGALYGTTSAGGGTNSAGTIFRLTTNGVLTTLYSFTGGTDGSDPEAALVEGKDGSFYGTTAGGGTNGQGTLFRITTNGVFSSLYSFGGAGDGGVPEAALTQGDDGTFYGTTFDGGASGVGTNGWGTIFRCTSAGGLTTLYSFKDGTDGANPLGRLTFGTDGALYGTASGGGAVVSGVTYQLGTAFRLLTNGTFSILHIFEYPNQGFVPHAGLAQGMDGALYGTTAAFNGNGVFRLTTEGDFTVLHPFDIPDLAPYGGVVTGKDGNLYGTLSDIPFLSASFYLPVIFTITTNRTYTILHSFSDLEGSDPYSSLVQGRDGNFYGTTISGGVNRGGTVFVAGPLAAPKVVTQPTSRDGNTGSSIILSANISSGAPFSYQWQINGSNILGATSSTLILTNLTSRDAGIYTLVASNSVGSVMSAPALLTLKPAQPAWNFVPLFSFDGDADPHGPQWGLIDAHDGGFFGVTAQGGTAGQGTIYHLTPDGVLTVIYSFTGGNDGSSPVTGLAWGTDGNLYGTTSGGERAALVPRVLGLFFESRQMAY